LQEKARKKLTEVARYCQDLPEVDRSRHHHFFERLFQALWDFKIRSGLRAQGTGEEAEGGGQAS